MGEEEVFFMCPYCWQEISMLLDHSVPAQEYIEDCEICCNPIQIRYRVDDDMISEFDARPLE